MTGCYTKDNYQLVISTTLLIVMISTVLFGTFMKPVQNFLIPPTVADKHEYEKPAEEEERIGDSEMDFRKTGSFKEEPQKMINPSGLLKDRQR